MKTSLRAAFGVASGPGGGVDGEDQRPVEGSRLHEEAAKPLGVHPATGQRFVEAAMGACELGFQAEGGDREDRPWRADHGVTDLEQSVAPAAEAAVQVLAEPDESVGVIRGVAMHHYREY
jgi:hypothetical protein